MRDAKARRFPVAWTFVPVALAITDFRCGTHLLLRRAMCAAEARATIRRSQFGMTGGLPNVAGDEVRIVIPVEAISE